MPLTILGPARDCCGLCRSSLEKSGYRIEDSEGARAFLCTTHLIALLQACLWPLKTVACEA